MISESQVSDAILAAMAAVDARGYAIDDLKGIKPVPLAYNEVHVFELAPDGARRVGAGTQVQHWHILIRSVGATFDNAREMRNRAGMALREVTLTVGGDFTVVEKDPSAADEPIAEDDGWYSGLSDYRCTT